MTLLEGKKALICGIANKKSIAWGIANAFHAHGARVAFTCLKPNLRRVNKLAARVNSGMVYPCDVSDDAEIKHAMDAAGRSFEGTLDILVHCIAYADPEDLGGEFINISRANWKTALDISAYSLVALARCARPFMNAAGGGSIIALTFEGGESVAPGYNIMGVAKAALNMSIRYLAYDLGPENIRVNALAAGPISTMSSLMIEDFDNALKLTEERSPLMRNIGLEDLGNTAVYLASHLSAAVTGAILKADSGMNIMCPPTVGRKDYAWRSKRAAEARVQEKGDFFKQPATWRCADVGKKADL